MIDCGRVWLGAQQTHFFFMGIQQLVWDIGLTPKIPDPWLSLSLSFLATSIIKILI